MTCVLIKREHLDTETGTQGECQVKMKLEIGVILYEPRSDFFLSLFILILFIFCLCWVFIAACGLSLVVAGGATHLLWCVGFSLWWLLLLQSMGSRHTSFSSCGCQAQ